MNLPLKKTAEPGSFQNIGLCGLALYRKGSSTWSLDLSKKSFFSAIYPRLRNALAIAPAQQEPSIHRDRPTEPALTAFYV
jgi:hypothetical protein